MWVPGHNNIPGTLVSVVHAIRSRQFWIKVVILSQHHPWIAVDLLNRCISSLVITFWCPSTITYLGTVKQGASKTRDYHTESIGMPLATCNLLLLDWADTLANNRWAAYTPDWCDIVVLPFCKKPMRIIPLEYLAFYWIDLYRIIHCFYCRLVSSKMTSRRKNACEFRFDIDSRIRLLSTTSNRGNHRIDTFRIESALPAGYKLSRDHSGLPWHFRLFRCQWWRTLFEHNIHLVSIKEFTNFVRINHLRSARYAI